MGARERAIMVAVDDLEVAVPRKRTRKTRNGGVKQEVKEKFMHEHQAKPIIAKTDAQKRYLHSLQFDTVSVGKGSAGTGKAQPMYSKISTPNGFVNMGDLVVGDELHTVDGTVTTVTGIYPQGEKEIIKFNFKDGTSVESCVDHLWTVYSNINTGNGKRLRKKVRMEMSTSDIVKLLDNKVGGNISTPTISPVYYAEKAVPIDPYLLGILIGDGTLSGTGLSFTTSDHDILTNVSSVLPDGYHVVKWKGKYSYGISPVDRGENGLIANLRELGLLGKTSYDKFVPIDYMLNSSEVRYSILQGLLDSDGTCDKNGSVSFCTTSNALANDVRNIVLSLGGKASVTKSDKYFTYKGSKKLGATAYIVSINVPDKAMLFRLPRKRDLVSKTQICQLSRNIISYEKIGVTDCQCISVAHESQLYLTDGFIATHNTYCAAAVAANKYLKGEISEIVVARAYVPMGKTTGFWPGTVEEKLLPFLTPILNVIKERVGVNRYLAEFGKTIKIQPLEAIRGMSFPAGTFLIIDESQNLNVDEVRSIVTRLEEGSQVAFCGDDKQRDIRGVSGIVYLTNLIKKYNLPNCSVTEFTPKDIVRSGLTKAFVEIFEKEGGADNVKEEDFE